MSVPIALATVARVGLATLRVKFTSSPTQASVTGVNDALNPVNYTISGPALNYVTLVTPVDGDSTSVDLSLAALMVPGTWVLTVLNIQNSDGGLLVSPTSINITISSNLLQESLTAGAQNPAVVNVLRSHFNPALKGPNFDALLTALASGDNTNWNNAALAFDQLFASTASGIYLDRRAGDFGINRPEGVDLSDNLFRELVVLDKSEKLTTQSLLEILEIFYGDDCVRSSIATINSQPYALTDGDQLRLLVDDFDVTITFSRNDFSNISNASALEVAAVITRNLLSAGSQGYAVTITDQTTKLTSVKVYSGRLGLSSSVQVYGGRSQLFLKFPDLPPNIINGSSDTNILSAFAVWTITQSTTTPGNLRFTSDPLAIYNISALQKGDLAYIYGSEFGASNIGTFVVQDTSFTYSGSNIVQWFEINNPTGATGTIAQLSINSFALFRPYKHTIYNNSRQVLVSQLGSEIEVTLPATTNVDRGPGIAAYPEGNASTTITSLVRSKGIITGSATAHGLSVGDQVLIDGAFCSNVVPPLTLGTISGAFSSNVANGVSNASLATTVSESDTFCGYGCQAVQLKEGMALVVGGWLQGGTIPVSNPAILEIVSESALTDGSRQQAYRWTNLATHAFTIGARGFGISILGDGRVLTTGGTGTDDLTVGPQGRANIFTYTRSPVQDIMVDLALPYAVSAHAQVTLQDGNAIITGGYTTPSVSLNTVRKFTQSTNAWTSKASMLLARRKHSAVVLKSGKVLVTGGLTNQPLVGAGVFCTPSCEIYDPVGDTWTATGAMAYARFGSGIFMIPDGRVIILGGWGRKANDPSTEVQQATCEIYDPGTGLWAPIPPMSSIRAYPAIGYNAGRNVLYVVGGGLYPNLSTIVDILDLKTLTWSRCPTGVGFGSFGSAGVIVGTDTFAVISGSSFQDYAGGVGFNNLSTSYLLIPGADAFGGGGFNGEHTIATVPDANTFTYSSPGRSAYAATSPSGTVTREHAPNGPAGIPGPFLFDKNAGLAITSTTAVVQNQLNAGKQTAILTVDNALPFPDAPGYLAFNFGLDSVVGPVKYLGRISPTQISLDASFTFPFTVPALTQVIMLSTKAPYQPGANQLVGTFYATNSAAGRIAAESFLDDATAAGFDSVRNVIYPGDSGLGGAGKPTSGALKLSDIVRVFAGDDVDTTVEDLRDA